jgi:drug/metabolite transporter (DMT)-like permease
MIGVALAVLSAVASALSVILVRKHSKESNTFNISLIISLIGLFVLWPLALLLTDFSGAVLLALLIFALSGIVTPGVVRLLYYQGMKKLGAPVNSSLFATYPLYTALMAHLFLGDVLLAGNWLGILLVFFSGVLVESSSRGVNGEGNYKRRSILLPLLGGLTLGVGSIMRKFALDMFNAPVLGVALAYTFSLLPFLAIYLAFKPTREAVSLKRDMRLFWVAGIGQAVTWLLGFYALSNADVSVVTSILSTEPVFVALFAYLYLKKIEKVSAKLLISIILTVVGIILVTMHF